MASVPGLCGDTMLFPGAGSGGGFGGAIATCGPRGRAAAGRGAGSVPGRQWPGPTSARSTLSVRGVSAARRLTLGKEWGFAPAGTSSVGPGRV